MFIHTFCLSSHMKNLLHRNSTGTFYREFIGLDGNEVFDFSYFVLLICISKDCLILFFKISSFMPFRNRLLFTVVVDFCMQMYYYFFLFCHFFTFYKE